MLASNFTANNSIFPSIICKYNIQGYKGKDKTKDTENKFSFPLIAWNIDKGSESK